MNISVTPKRLLKTQTFEKKTIFPAKNLIRSFFSHFAEYEIPQETIFKAPHGIVTVIVQVIRSFL